MYREETAIEGKNIGWVGRVLASEGGIRHEIVGSIEELGSLLDVEAVTVAVQTAEIVCGDFCVSVETQVAGSLTAVISELEMGVRICFAPIAAEGTIFCKIDQRHLTNSLCHIVCRCTGKRLDHPSER